MNFHRRPKDANVQEWTRTSQDEDLWDFLTENSDGYISVRESFRCPKTRMSTFRGYLTQWVFLDKSFDPKWISTKKLKSKIPKMNLAFVLCKLQIIKTGLLLLWKCKMFNKVFRLWCWFNSPYISTPFVLLNFLFL